MKKTPIREDDCYYLGYENPAAPLREFEWLHLTNLNAFVCGQADYQNQAPRNLNYSRDDYDPDTFERLRVLVEETD